MLAISRLAGGVFGKDLKQVMKTGENDTACDIVGDGIKKKKKTKSAVRQDNNSVRSDHSQVLLIKDAFNETVDIEPSFYQKEEIADDIKSVMRNIDDMLKEASKPVNSHASDTSEKVTASPLEQFNTLHRNVEGVRASIRLKESHLV